VSFSVVYWSGFYESFSSAAALLHIVYSVPQSPRLAASAARSLVDRKKYSTDVVLLQSYTHENVLVVSEVLIERAILQE
jgi:hypothetical protein